MNILGVDFGDSRTGIAIASNLGKLAQPLCMIESKKPAETAEKVVDIATENDVAKIVIGLPKNMDGSLGFRAEATQEFGKLVEELSKLEVVYVDERLTTVSAASYLNKCGVRGKKRKHLIDVVSSVIILQNYLDSHIT